MRSLGVSFAQNRREDARTDRRTVTLESSCGGKRGALDQHEPFVEYQYAYPERLNVLHRSLVWKDVLFISGLISHSSLPA